jgi:D-alanyl-D-alanine carboxypeptidase (penicillin-binding protein 5/6)
MIFKRNVRILAVSVTLIVFLSSLPVYAREQEKPDPNRPRYESSILMDAETGQVLFEYKPDKKHIPASLVKMMVMLLTVEAIEQGVFSVDQKVHVSREASKIGGSQVYLKQGEIFPLGELLKAVVIASGNDAAYAIAEHIAGTPEGMVELMNKRARELGMTQTIYTNVHGLPPGRGQEQDYTSARDIAILGREIVKHPLLLGWGGTYKDSFRNGKFTLWNTNKLLRTFRGMDGIKTGYYAKAGYNLCATAKRDGLRLISVVLGSPKQKDRVRETRRLLTQGFRVYKKLTFFGEDEPIGKPVPVSQGKKKTTTIATAKPVTVLVKRLHGPKVKTRITLSENPLQAPVKEGQEVGKAELVLDDEVLASTPLVAVENVARKTWLDRLKFWKK